MTKTLLILSAAILVSACSSTVDPIDYASQDCGSLRSLVQGQDYAAATRGVEIYNDRGVDEIRQESGSPWAGEPRTRDQQNIRNERQAIREAYRRKGCVK